MRGLKVSDNARHLVWSEGYPFFYLGDTAWELFHRLTREEADHYLANRARLGFTVIQAVILAELDGLNTPNAYGHRPLQDHDPAKPVEAYFQQVDYVVEKAESLRLVMGILPTWGDKVGPKAWGVGPEVFNAENAFVYGRFLGARYRDRELIWILGGDRMADDDGKKAIWRAMARGLAEGDGGRHLMTYHPQGWHSSSEWLHNEGWLDFNMIQSGHSDRDAPNYRLVSADYQRMPTKPTLDGEPRYEDHPVNWDPKNGWFDDCDVRQAAYWGVLAGGCGTTYGCQDIWQFWHKGVDPISHARTEWRQALDLPGARQMHHLRDLMMSRRFWDMVPDQGVIVSGQGEGVHHVQAARGREGHGLVAYLPTGRPITVDLGKLSGPAAVAHWFDPRTGGWAKIGEYPCAGEREFIPPSSGRGNDWVLVLDGAGREAAAT